MFGNRVLQLGVHHAHDTLTLARRERRRRRRPARSTSPASRGRWSALRVGDLRGGEALAVRPFAGARRTCRSPSTASALRRSPRKRSRPDRPIVDARPRALPRHPRRFEYDPSFTDVSTPLSAVLAARRGVCQDFAHLAVGCLRTLGLAARYVSGYIETDPPPGRPRLVGADASHAWCSVWVPQQGWIDFDPTNDHLPTHRHVTRRLGPRLRRRRARARRRHRPAVEQTPDRRGRRRAHPDEAAAAGGATSGDRRLAESRAQWIPAAPVMTL